MKIKLNSEVMRYITLLETLTGATIKDCLIEDNKLIFVVNEGEAGIAIGKDGKNVRKVSEITGKEVEVMEFSPDPKIFVRNIFKPLKVGNVQLHEQGGKKIMRIETVKNHPLTGSKLRRAKLMLQKYFEIDDVLIS
ncbi:MAG: NusA-like transcription termination signal-binding factor [Candidatus Nanoarchaeia archaeon]|nr:NusA-like transcription termination signal-binding factor [Candidatus Haiyanarchaeum thermophilum]